ncbi:MAG TPA: hypothetical protein VJ821_08855 [Anaerolineales bacterium]|nr:hypothetical protein [Anaerolineales bacterium]
MSILEQLLQDRATLNALLTAREAVPTETMRTIERVAWDMYLTMLRDALNTLDSLIEHLTPKPD